MILGTGVANVRSFSGRTTDGGNFGFSAAASRRQGKHENTANAQNRSFHDIAPFTSELVEARVVLVVVLVL